MKKSLILCYLSTFVLILNFRFISTKGSFFFDDEDDEAVEGSTENILTMTEQEQLDATTPSLYEARSLDSAPQFENETTCPAISIKSEFVFYLYTFVCVMSANFAYHLIILLSKTITAKTNSHRASAKTPVRTQQERLPRDSVLYEEVEAHYVA